MTKVLADKLHFLFYAEPFDDFKRRVCQALSAVRTKYSNPDEYPCFYYYKINNRYERITLNPDYRDDGSLATAEFKPHFYAYQKKLVERKLLTYNDLKQLNSAMLQLETKLGLAEVIHE